MASREAGAIYNNIGSAIASTAPQVATGAVLPCDLYCNESGIPNSGTVYKGVHKNLHKFLSTLRGMAGKCGTCFSGATLAMQGKF